MADTAQNAAAGLLTIRESMSPGRCSIMSHHECHARREICSLPRGCWLQGAGVEFPHGLPSCAAHAAVLAANQEHSTRTPATVCPVSPSCQPQSQELAKPRPLMLPRRTCLGTHQQVRAGTSTKSHAWSRAHRADWSAGCVGTQSDQAGKASSCAGCPNQAACASGAGRKVDPGMSLGLHLHVTVTSCLRSRLVARSCPGSGGTVVRRESHDPGSVWQGRCWQEHRVCTASLHAGIAGQACAWWSAQPDAYRHLTCVRACSQVGLLDVDICGPSIPRMLGLSGREVHQSGSGWSPVWLDDNLGVMSIGFVLPATDDAVIWRGPRKSGTCRDPCVGLAVFAWRPMAGRS